MKTYKFSKTIESNEVFKLKICQEEDYSVLIKESAMIHLNGSGWMKYIPNAIPNSKDIGRLFHSLEFRDSVRLGGLKENAVYFGGTGRTGLKEPYCNLSKMFGSHPEIHELLYAIGQIADRKYKEAFPAIHRKHLDAVINKDGGIHQDYLMGDSVFSNGVLNSHLVQQSVHVDRGNYSDVMSCLVAFKNNCIGGYLCFPEYDFSVELSDGALLIFNGQEVFHGVTPMEINPINGYRYTAVYYTMDKMWNCLSLEEELEKMKRNEELIIEKYARKNI